MMLSYLFTLHALSGALKDKPTEPIIKEHSSAAFWSNAAGRQPFKKRDNSVLESVMKIANRQSFSIEEVAQLLTENQSLLKAVLAVWMDTNKDGSISNEEFSGKHCTARQS